MCDSRLCESSATNRANSSNCWCCPSTATELIAGNISIGSVVDFLGSGLDADSPTSFNFANCDNFNFTGLLVSVAVLVARLVAGLVVAVTVVVVVVVAKLGSSFLVFFTLLTVFVSSDIF